MAMKKHEIQFSGVGRDGGGANNWKEGEAV